MRPSRSMTRRMSSAADSTSSASTSPERGIDDDNESFMFQSNDSQSSLALSIPEELSDSLAQEMEERCRVSPISRLPNELMVAIFQKLGSTADLKNCMLVNREWAQNSVSLLWHRPQTQHWIPLHSVVMSLRSAHKFFDYDRLVKRLNLSSLNKDVSDGTLQPFQTCKRIERLTLTNCSNLTDMSIVKVVEGNRVLLALDTTSIEALTDKTLNSVANNCFRLQGLNTTGCHRITDEGLEAIAQSCRHLKRLKLNGCHRITDKSILSFAANCRQILEIDLHECRLIEDESVTALVADLPNLRELRLAHCWRVTDHAFLNLPFEQTYENMRILDLTDCGELTDGGVQKIVQAMPRLRNLVLAKCRQLTDRAVLAITRLQKNLHYIHLGHCARITDHGVLQLIRHCNRIRYIDLACCTMLTDNSVTQLATLPKLKRIGLVKCGNITNRSIYALAKPKQTVQGGPTAPSCLERVHLSYCTTLTLSGITALLNSCPRLTHLSLTGVPAFLREDLIVFCREAPQEFNEHQRELFCVFSGDGVTRLKNYLNEMEKQAFDAESTMYDDDNLMDDDISEMAVINADYVIPHWTPLPPAQQNPGQQQLPPQPIGPPPPPPHNAPQHALPPHAQPSVAPAHPPQHLPPLHIQIPPIGDLVGPNGSPTNDAPLTLDDGEEGFGFGSETIEPQ